MNEVNKCPVLFYLLELFVALGLRLGRCFCNAGDAVLGKQSATVYTTRGVITRTLAIFVFIFVVFGKGKPRLLTTHDARCYLGDSRQPVNLTDVGGANHDQIRDKR